MKPSTNLERLNDLFFSLGFLALVTLHWPFRRMADLIEKLINRRRNRINDIIVHNNQYRKRIG